MPKVIDWEPIKRAYLASGASYETIAKQFKVSERSVESRAATEGWAKSREQVRSVLKPINQQPPKQQQRLPRRADSDPVAIIDDAIAAMEGQLRSEDSKGAASAASALVRLLEYREKLLPPTAAALAARAIALGITPDQFLEELRKQWALLG